MNGTVKNVTAKRFGYIHAEDNRDYFFHKDDFHGHWDDLEVDVNSAIVVPVTFKPTENPKGLRAQNVSRTDYPNQVAQEAD